MSIAPTGIGTVNRSGRRPSFAAIVAAEVRAAAARQMVTHRDLAEALGLSPMYLSRRMRGELPFDVDELAAICKLLGVTIADLLPGTVSTDDPVSIIRSRRATAGSRSRKLPRLDSNQEPYDYRARDLAAAA